MLLISKSTMELSCSHFRKNWRLMAGSAEKMATGTARCDTEADWGLAEMTNLQARPEERRGGARARERDEEERSQEYAENRTS